MKLTLSMYWYPGSSLIRYGHHNVALGTSKRPCETLPVVVKISFASNIDILYVMLAAPKPSEVALLMNTL